MTSILKMFLLVCVVFVSGCHCDKQTPEYKNTENEVFHMIQIHNFKVTKETLILNYQVTNPFAYDIWICDDVDTDGKYDVATRIDIEKVWIRLRFKLERNIFRNPPAFGKYLRLLPGESHSGRILLSLPVRNASPVFDFQERHKNHKQVVLNQVIFEIGYFEGELINRLSNWFEKTKHYTASEDLLQFEPLMVEEILGGQPRKILWCTHIWPGISMEKSVKDVVSDINIPCFVVVNDR